MIEKKHVVAAFCAGWSLASVLALFVIDAEEKRYKRVFNRAKFNSDVIKKFAEYGDEELVKRVYDETAFDFVTLDLDDLKGL